MERKYTDEIVTDLDILQQRSKPTTLEEVENLNLKERIIEANDTAWTKGAGLAAIQIGIPLKYAWLKYEDEKKRVQRIELINPKILKNSRSVIIGKEGCLSLPDQWFRTLRYEETIYENNGLIYTARGWPAIIIQHEVDHMFGTLCTARRYRKTKIGRNAPCPECEKDGRRKKWKKCGEHNSSCRSSIY